jgi:hypothetical protein
MISPKLQLLSGHTTEQSLAVYRALGLAEVAGEYEEAMKTFPVRCVGPYCRLSHVPSCGSQSALITREGELLTDVFAVTADFQALIAQRQW